MLLSALPHAALQIYTLETWTPVKKCKSYKYLPYTLKCRSVDVTVNHCKSVHITFFHYAFLTLDILAIGRVLKHANCIIFVLQLSTFLAWRQLFASHTIIIFNWGTLSCYFAHGRAASFALWPENLHLVQKELSIFSTKMSQIQTLKHLLKSASLYCFQPKTDWYWFIEVCVTYS